MASGGAARAPHRPAAAATLGHGRLLHAAPSGVAEPRPGPTASSPSGRRTAGALRLRTIGDACTRECLSIDVARRLRSDDVFARRTARFVQRGPPASLRSDNGPA